jgi:hypothetical protein
MQAKRIPIEVVRPELAEPKLRIASVAPPPQKGDRKLFPGGASDVPEVVRLLRDEAQVI